MAAEDRDERTEAPTERRRQESREQGSIPRSTDLHAAVLAAAATGALYFLGGDLAQALTTILRESLSAAPWVQTDHGRLLTSLWQIAGTLARGLIPFLATLVLAAIAVGGLQAGFHISPSAIQPNWSRLNPLTGFGRIFSLQGTVRVLGSLLKVLILGAVAGAFLWSELPQFLSLASIDLAPLSRFSGESLAALSFQLSLALVILAILDYGYQFWQFEQNLKMTRQELRDELRMMEGDPQLRQRRKEIHRKLTDSRQVLRVKEADALVTNPTEIAVALKYDAKQMDAPIVLAKGMGLMAQRLREAAAEHGVPIIEKKPLARALFEVRIGDPVPIELYTAVAEILAYVMRLRKNRRPRRAA